MYHTKERQQESAEINTSWLRKTLCAPCSARLRLASLKDCIRALSSQPKVPWEPELREINITIVLYYILIYDMPYDKYSLY